MPEFERRIPEGDTRERLVCTSCGYICYENPTVVVAAVVADHGRVLLCRRAITPRRGFWTLPGGFLEQNETTEEGAQREVFEESGARIRIDGILAVFCISRISQVQVIFRARFDGPPAFAPGVETSDVRLFAADEIPWPQLAFPTNAWALKAWQAVGDGPLGPPATNPKDDPRGVHWSLDEVEPPGAGP